jgi:limonene-1,2-epoxide hydrolase
MSIEIVTAAVDAWNRKDAAAVATTFTPAGVWHNVPLSRVEGREAIQAAVARFLARVDRVEWKIVHIARSATGVVLTERRDVFVLPNGRVADLPVMGVFEISNGLIAEWRDYFDRGMLAEQMGTG